MKQYLKNYQVVMRTLGPVFIGSGNDIGKKEYVFLNNDKVGIPDFHKLYGELEKRKKAREYEQYLLGNGREDLTGWLRKQNIRIEDIKPFIKYTLDCGDAVLEKGANKLQVMECIKDAYGNPYIPGSSLKGMFRTIFLGSDIIKESQKYENAKSALRKSADIKTGRNSYLKKNISAIENISYRTLGRKGEKIKEWDAVNDRMQGFIVSDSEPLSTDALVLCQKVELHTDGTEKRLPILRECIKPGIEIKYQITIDTSVCIWTDQMILQAVADFMKSYYKNFGIAFAGIKKGAEHEVFLGGGCGFVSKTIIYPMYGRKDGIEMTRNIFDKTGVPRIHKHDKDRIYGASPHILKCSKYQGKTIQMGLCNIETIKQM